MRNFCFVLALCLTLLFFASWASAKNAFEDNLVIDGLYSWGFIFVETEKPKNGKKYIGYGGFKDEASCIAEAETHLKNFPDSFEVLCFSPFQNSLAPYKVAQSPIG